MTPQIKSVPIWVDRYGSEHKTEKAALYSNYSYSRNRLEQAMNVILERAYRRSTFNERLEEINKCFEILRIHRADLESLERTPQ